MDRLTAFLGLRIAEIKRQRKKRDNREILVIAVDMDGVLCKGEMWGEGDPAPIKKNIEKINTLSKRHFIVIHTARRKDLAYSTISWLEKHEVQYHAIRFDKMPADVYIDDKAFNFELEKVEKPLSSSGSNLWGRLVKPFKRRRGAP